MVNQGNWYIKNYGVMLQENTQLQSMHFGVMLQENTQLQSMHFGVMLQENTQLQSMHFHAEAIVAANCHCQMQM